MAIQRKPKVVPIAAEVDSFIQGAPDARPAPMEPAAPPPASTYDKGIAKGNKRQISLTIAPDLLRKVDETAARTGQTRAAIINMAIFSALEGNVFQR